MVSKITVAALVLMVAVPTMLGYALAFEDRTVTGWNSSDRVNVTDLLLNAETPYFVPSASTMNNSELLVELPNDYLYMRIPDYMKVSDTATSFPVYESVSHSMEADYTYSTYTTSGTTVSGSGTFIAPSQGIPIASPNNAAIYITTASEATLTYIGGEYTGTTFGPFVQTADDRWTWGSITVGSDPSTFKIASAGANTYTVARSIWEQTAYNGDLTMTVPHPVNIRFQLQDSSYAYYLSTAASNTIVQTGGNTVTVNGNYTQYGVTQFYLATTDGTTGSAFNIDYHGDYVYYVDAHDTATHYWPGVGHVNDFYFVNMPINTRTCNTLYFANMSYPNVAIVGNNSYSLPGNSSIGCYLYMTRASSSTWNAYDDNGNLLFTAPDNGFFIGAAAADDEDVMLWVGNRIDINPSNAIGGAISTDSFWIPTRYGTSIMAGHSDSTITYYTNTTRNGAINQYTETYRLNLTNGNLYRNDVLIDTGVLGLLYADGTMNNPVNVAVACDLVTTYSEQCRSTSASTAGTANQYQQVSYGSGITASDPTDPYGLMLITTADQTPATLTYNGGTFFSPSGSLGPFVQVSETSWIFDGKLVDATHFSVTTTYGSSFNIRTFGYTDLSSIDGEFAMNTMGASAYRFVHTDSSVSYWPIWKAYGSTEYVSLSLSGSTAVVGDHVEYNVSSVGISSNHPEDYVYTQLERGSNYADPAYGWQLYKTIESPSLVDQYWLNSSDNESIRMMIALENGEEVTLTPIGSTTADSVSILMLNDNIYIGGTAGQNLGKYSFVQVEISGSGARISGIGGWPTMGAAAKVYNTVSVEFENKVEMFSKLLIKSPYTVEYRVDEASVKAGTFPSIIDNTLDLASKWPGKSYSVQISSAGVYGDSISFGGNDYTVTDGTITVNGSPVSLLRAVFSSTYDSEEETWTNTINNVQVSTGYPSTLTFGGEWSATIAAYSMDEFERTEKVWQPGVFAFNGLDNSFALLGLATAVAVFIGLGLYGRRSGAKVGTLMLVCGACAAVFLCLIV